MTTGPFHIPSVLVWKTDFVVSLLIPLRAYKTIRPGNGPLFEAQKGNFLLNLNLCIVCVCLCTMYVPIWCAVSMEAGKRFQIPWNWIGVIPSNLFLRQCFTLYPWLLRNSQRCSCWELGWQVSVPASHLGFGFFTVYSQDFKLFFFQRRRYRNKFPRKHWI